MERKDHTLNMKIDHHPLDIANDKWGPSTLRIEMEGDRDLLKMVESAVMRLSLEAEGSHK